MVGHPLFRIDFYHQMMVHNGFKQAFNQPGIPWLFFYAGAIKRGIVSNLIEMPDDIEATLFHHLFRLRIKRPHHALNITFKIALHLQAEILKVAINIHIFIAIE